MSKVSACLPGSSVKLTKSVIDSIEAPGIYKDIELTGFRLRVGNGGVKSYQLAGKVKGDPRPVYVTIGKHGDPWTPDSARKEAERLRLLMRQGVNPNRETKERRAQEEQERAVIAAEQKIAELTVGAAFEEFIETKKQKDNTVRVYRWIVNKHLSDWLDKPLVDISQEDVLKCYSRIEAVSPSSAAHAMRIFRAIFLTAQIRHSEKMPALAKINPVKFLSHAQKGWNRVEARSDFIRDEDLPAFYKAVTSLENELVRDYLMVCLLTGLRKSEACQMRWSENVDIRRRTITITDTKNGQRHMLAMSDQLYDLFLRRWQAKDSEYVFPGKSVAGHFNDPEKQIKKVIDLSGIERFSSHSLRRTFATVADSLGYRLEEVQRLLNHKPGSIAQRHYILNLVERTKEPMQRINDRLFELMLDAENTGKTSNVVCLSKAASL